MARSGRPISAWKKSTFFGRLGRAHR